MLTILPINGRYEGVGENCPDKLLPTAAVCKSSPDVVKFKEDNFRYEDDRFVVLCEGIVLDSPDVYTKQGCDSLSDLLIKLYLENAERLYNTLHGSFVLVIIDKQQGRAYIVNDLLSKRPVYYYTDEQMFCCATSFWELYDLLKRSGVRMQVNMTAVGSMLAGKNMIEDCTYIEEIHYLEPFAGIALSDGGLSLHRQPYPEVEPSTEPDAAIDRLQKLFSAGCALQYEKASRSGYRIVNSLSGGLDSKAVLLAGEQLGYKPELFFTYAEGGSKDESIPRRIAADRATEHIFFAMDGGGFLGDRDEKITANEGMFPYPGTTGLIPVVRQLDCSDIGIVNCGLGGGEVMGDINASIKGYRENRTAIERSVNSRLFRSYAHEILPDEQQAEQLAERLEKKYVDYNRFVSIHDTRVCLNFARTSKRYFEAVSPFLYEDMFCYALTIPVELKTHRKLYRRWYERYMQNPYETTGRPWVDADSKDTMLKKGIRTIRRVMLSVGKKLNAKKKAQSRPQKTEYDMNPYEYWWATNPKLRSDIVEMYTNDLADLAMLDEGLKRRLDAVWNGKLSAKVNVLTVTWALCRMGASGRAIINAE